MITHSTASLTPPNPYLEQQARRSPDRWSTVRRTVVRTVLISVPGQAAGRVLGVLILAAAGGLTTGPDLGFMISCLAAVVTGSAIGVVTTPGPRERPLCAACSIGIGAAVSLLLMMLAGARMPAGTIHPGAADLAPGVLVAAIGQGLIGWAVWLIKARLRSRS